MQADRLAASTRCVFFEDSLCRKRGWVHARRVPGRSKSAYRKEPPGKSRDRLQAAVGRKKGKSESAIAAQLGRSQSVISEWLNRLQSEGLGADMTARAPGRPCRLTKEQQEQAKADLSREPMQSGFERWTWTAGLVCIASGKHF